MPRRRATREQKNAPVEQAPAGFMSFLWRHGRQILKGTVVTAGIVVISAGFSFISALGGERKPKSFKTMLEDIDADGQALKLVDPTQARGVVTEAALNLPPETFAFTQPSAKSERASASAPPIK